MVIDRVENAKKGIISGLLNKTATILMPFLVQTALIRIMGIQYAGLQGVFSSVLSVLNVAELGFGSAIAYCMYKPIAHDNADEINALLFFCKKAYYAVGIIILVLGVLLMPILNHIVTRNDTGVNIIIVYFLYLLNTVLSYFLFAYKSTLLNAFQRFDVISNIGTLVSVGMCILQIALMVIFKNYYLHIVIAIFFTIVSNLLISKQVDHLYPEIRCKGKLSAEAYDDLKQRVKGVLISKICGVTRNAFDSIFVSMFMGIAVAGIYSNYYYVMNALIGIMSIVSPALLGGVGNSIQIETVEKNYADMQNLNSIYMLISGWAAICLLCFYQPFMEMWAGADNMFSMQVVVLFVVYFFVRQMGNVRGIYSDAAGLFWENRYRTLLEAIANVVLNYYFVIKFGVEGIVGATIISLLFIGFLGSTEVLFRCYFKKGCGRFLFDSIKYLFYSAMTAGIIYVLSGMLEKIGIIAIIARLVMCVLVAPVVLLFLWSFDNKDRMALRWLLGIVKMRKTV